MQRANDVLFNPVGTFLNSSDTVLSRSGLPQSSPYDASNWFSSEDLPVFQPAQSTNALSGFFVSPLLNHSIPTHAVNSQPGFRLIPSPQQQNVFLADPLFGENFAFDDFINAQGEDQEETVNELGATEEEPVNTQRRRIRSAEWDKHRRTLRRLYMDENKSAKETREYMIQNHRFEASVKAYKNKFSEWKWTKNLNPVAARHMLAEAERRKRECNKATKFVMGGQQFTVERVERCLQRAKPSTRDVNHPGEDDTTLAAIRYLTPSTLSSPANRTATPFSPLRPYMHQLHLPFPSAVARRDTNRQVPTRFQIDIPLISAAETNEEEIRIQPVEAPQVQPRELSGPGPGPAPGEDRLDYARSRVELGDEGVEPSLVTFLTEMSESLTRRLQAGAALMDLHSKLGSILPDTALLMLRDVIDQALHGKGRLCFSQFRSLVALCGRFALHGRYKDALLLFKGLESLAERVFFGSPSERIILLVCFGRLLTQESAEQAKPFFHQACSIALSYGHFSCRALHKLQSLYRQPGAQQPVHDTQALCCPRVCHLESEVLDFETQITPQILDSLFHSFC